MHLLNVKRWIISQKNPETHTTHKQTNKQTNNFDTRMYPRAFRCFALDLQDFVIFSLSDWMRIGLVEQLF